MNNAGGPLDAKAEVEDKKAELGRLLSSAEGVQKPVLETETLEARDMWLGSTVRASEVGELSVQRPSRMVFIAGMQASGKTTLLATLYDSFLRGPLEAVQFAGSRSLSRFEEISLYARVESERPTASTKRTNFNKEEIDFVHLDLMRRDSGARFNLFLTDISGEAFERARDSADETKRLKIAAYADVMCFLIDAAKLVDRRRRHVAQRDLDLLVESLIRSNLLRHTELIQLVVARSDLVPQGDDKSLAFIEAAVERVASRLNDAGLSMTRFMVAARPKTGAPRGVTELFHSWFEKGSIERFRPPQFSLSADKDDFGMVSREEDDNS